MSNDSRSTTAHRCIALAVCLLAAAAPAPRARAFDGPSNFTRVWGSLWYLRSTHEVDAVTLVFGGVDGSSALVSRDVVKKKSYWVFLEGASMDVSFGAITPPEAVTSVPGDLIVSAYPYIVEEKKEANKRDLSYALCDVWSYTKDKDKIKHMPFFFGKGWNGGAWYAEAQSICQSMTIAIELAASSPAKGRVIVQDPIGGKLLADGAAHKVVVTLDGSDPPAVVAALSAAADGTSMARAIPVVPAPGERFALAAGEMTTAHADILPPGSTEKMNDLVFRLPAEAANELITVSEEGMGDRLRLTMWTWDGGAPTSPPWLGSTKTQITAFAPRFRFLQPNDHCYLAVEFPSRNLGSVQLRFEW